MNENQSGDTVLREGRQDEARQSARGLVMQLGPHPATVLGLDLEAEDDLPCAEWLVASILLRGRVSESAALEAWRRLAKEGLQTPSGIARVGASAVLPLLEEARLAKSEATAAVLYRVCTALVRRHAGSVDVLAAGADGLEDLAQRLAVLGAGFGRAAVLRFLTPLRDRWTPANDLPASAAVCAAARHLGWIGDTQDEEGAPSSLARWLSRNESTTGDLEGAPPPLRDVEAALDRLGRAACLRDRTDRCPLAGHCPQSLC